jgi:dTDP-3,4-didehydro-2,6-dideoxy-alpha-D-glucose 3-reductase
MSSEPGVAVWGLGRHATRRVLPALAGCRSVRIAGICTRNEESGRAAAGRYECEYFASPSLMLGDPRVDVVYVATPTGLHFAHGRLALEAGKHVWCEKPLTHSHATTCELFQIAEKAGLMLACGLMYKYHPQFAAIKRVVSEQLIGDLKVVSIRFGMPNLDVATFRADPDLGGGALLDLGCYPLSIAYQLLDPSPVLRLAHVATMPSCVDSQGWAILQSGDTLVDSAWGMGRAYQNKLEIWGSKGLLVADRVFTKEDDYDSRVFVSDQRGGEATVLRSGRASGLRSMIDVFAAGLSSSELRAAERREVEWCALMAEEISGYR